MLYFKKGGHSGQEEQHVQKLRCEILYRCSKKQNNLAMLSTNNTVEREGQEERPHKVQDTVNVSSTVQWEPKKVT